MTVQAQKKSISITSSEFIQAEPSEVHQLLIQLDRYPEWSPFLVEDPNQKNHVTGKSGEVGSTFHWEGVAEKSKGYQTLTTIKGQEYLKMECTMEKPFKGSPVFEYELQPKNGGVEVIQSFDLKLSGFAYFMTKLIGLKKKMSQTNQLGLKRLKDVAEQS